ERAADARGVLGGADLGDTGRVVPGAVEDPPGQVGPAERLTTTCDVVRTVGRPLLQQVHDRRGQVGGECGTTHLVAHHLGVDTAPSQGGHRAHEVAPVADHPRGAEQVVPGGGGRRRIAGGLGLPIHPQRGDRVVLPVGTGGGAVEHVVAGDVHQG